MNALRTWLQALGAMAAIVALASPAAALGAHPGPIRLKDLQGNDVAAGAATPYSPDKTCGRCHDVAAISQGYHFQQGRTTPTGEIQVSDTFGGDLFAGALPGRGTGAWWKLLDGMYGKW